MNLKTYYISHDKWFNNLDTILGEYRFSDQGVIEICTDVLKKNKFQNDFAEPEYFQHPVVITHYALVHYDQYLKSQSDKHLKVFIDQVEGLIKLGVRWKETMVYPFPFRNDRYGVSDGWVSGMYQGEALSCFSRANAITGEEKYKQLAQLVFNSFSLPYDDRYGFMNTDEYGLWFEEVPSKPPAHILNGFIFAMFGIWDYHRVFCEPEAKKIFSRCLLTLKNSLPLYDTGYWTYYDLNGVMAPMKYHLDVHIPQLKALYEISGDEVFMRYGQKWEHYAQSRWNYLRSRISHVTWKLSGEKVRFF